MKRLNVFLMPAAALALIAIIACSVESKKADSTAAAGDTAVSTGAATAPLPGAAVAPAPDAAAPAAAAPSATSSGGMLDPNSASRADLAAIPGMTDAVITAVTAGRPYANMIAVDKVLAANLSERQRDSVYTRLWRPIDLNTASDEEILLIPGVGPRMRREFKEYRPYTSIEQFRREIGKYVDKDELARLERYVVIR
jgi:DNA uptake protein ComE-like DNA-binding protein